MLSRSCKVVRRNGPHPCIKSRLTTTQSRKLGLQKGWAYEIIKRAGNYGEVFEKNAGQGSSLKIPRPNALKSDGSQQEAPVDPLSKSYRRPDVPTD